MKATPGPKCLSIKINGFTLTKQTLIGRCLWFLFILCTLTLNVDCETLDCLDNLCKDHSRYWCSDLTLVGRMMVAPVSWSDACICYYYCCHPHLQCHQSISLVVISHLLAVWTHAPPHPQRHPAIPLQDEIYFGTETQDLVSSFRWSNSRVVSLDCCSWLPVTKLDVTHQ